MKRGRAVVLGGGLGGLLLVAAMRVGAEGIPSVEPLRYSGVLEDESGVALTGPANVEVKLWPAATGGTTPLCTTSSQSVVLEGGRFTVALPEECTDAVHDHADTWIEVLFNGATLGRSPMGAVPYAVETDHARVADTLGVLTPAQVQQRVAATCPAGQSMRAINPDGSVTCDLGFPAGAVVAFDLGACPTGWTELTTARGRTIIGVTSGLTRGTAVGANSMTLSAAQMPSHAHSGTTGSGNAMTHQVGSQIGTGSLGDAAAGWLIGGALATWTNAQYAGANHTHDFTTAAAGGGQAFDNRQDSLPLLYCRKS